MSETLEWKRPRLRSQFSPPDRRSFTIALLMRLIRGEVQP